LKSTFTIILFYTFFVYLLSSSQAELSALELESSAAKTVFDEAMEKFRDKAAQVMMMMMKKN
jgi:hypothetical protein